MAGILPFPFTFMSHLVRPSVQSDGLVGSGSGHGRASLALAAEGALWRRFLEEANVNLSPGSACRIGEPGFMRVVFPCVAPEAAAIGVARMAKVLGLTTS